MQSFDIFKVGDTVYAPSVDHKRVPVTCPDCNDKRTWRVITAANRFTITCPRCNGAQYDWQQPHRTELTLEIREYVVHGVSIDWERHRDVGEGLVTRVRYSLYNGEKYAGNGFGASSVFPSREAAEAAGSEMLAKHAAEEDKRWAEQRERVAKSAGETVVQVISEKANASKKEIERKLDDLKERLTSAIRHPSLYGPKLRKEGAFGSYEITSETMAEWLNELFSEAGLDGWSEEEIHEATCHC